MEYRLYTTVDITNTGQYKPEPGKENLRWKEQNFQTVVQTLALRANIQHSKPELIEVPGKSIGFNFDKVIKVWKFEFETERDYPLGTDEDPVLFLKQDFNLVPYIHGLDEVPTSNRPVFITEGENKNIVFQQRQ
jgi:hypothetical protein